MTGLLGPQFTAGASSRRADGPLSLTLQLTALSAPAMLLSLPREPAPKTA